MSEYTLEDIVISGVVAKWEAIEFCCALPARRGAPLYDIIFYELYRRRCTIL